MKTQIQFFLLVILISVTGCKAPDFTGEEILDWVDAWNSYDLNAIDELFVQSDDLSYFSSEKEGVIRGFEAVKTHHEGFGFVPGGNKSQKRLILVDVDHTCTANQPIVTAIWYFQHPDGRLQKGPVSISYVYDGNAYRIQHMHFANYTYKHLPDVKGGTQGQSLDGKALLPAEPNERVLQMLESARTAWEQDSSQVENWIWLGRWTAYAGDYRRAINIYSQAMVHFPGEPRLFRHRGHRYISIREFDRAIFDFEMAASLIRGKENSVEPDGMPNAQNIPISTLHGNIWYHLGLAHFLKHQYPQALEAYEQGLVSTSNDDNVVSVTHWLYTIHRLMGNVEAAQQVLDPIRKEMNIIENQSYHQLCLLYKGMIDDTELMKDVPASSAGDATRFGLAMWYRYNNDSAKSEQLLKATLEGPVWASFGYIAAEAALY